MKIITSHDTEYNNLYHPFHKKYSPTPLLSPLDIEYSEAYATGCAFENISFMIVNNNEPVAAFTGSIQQTNNNKLLNGFGRPAMFFEKPDMSTSDKKSLKKLVNKQLNNIYTNNEFDNINFIDFLSNQSLNSISLFLLDNGATSSCCFTQIIDLHKPESELRQNIRKSYKSLINWGNNNLNIQVINKENINKEIMEEFRQFHIQIAGKETRSKTTWNIQLKQVIEEEAFLVIGKINAELVSAAFFETNSNSCYYGVSAAKREIFEKPLSHGIIWNAILYAKHIGCKTFETGEQLYANHKFPTKKELNISGFKRGFGGETKIRLRLCV